MRVQLRKSERGTVLMTTLILALLTGIAAAALIMLTQQQNVLTTRSMMWGSELPLAEAGIEEAMAHINLDPPNFASEGWTNAGTNVVKTRSLGSNGGFYYTAISTARPPVIISIGYCPVPRQTNYTQRTVMVRTRRNRTGFGVVAKGLISMSGGGSIDSFDSADPTHSNSGLYDPTKALDNAFVGSLSSATPAIKTGTGKIYGSAATGVGGTVSGTVGDGVWDSTSSGIQPGHASDDFNMAIPDVVAPYTSGLPLPTAVGGIYTLTAGDYYVGSSLTIPGGVGMVISGPGKVRLYVTGDFTTSGSGYVQLLAGSSFELYIGGKGTISGGGVVNGTQLASSCAIYGMPTCTTMTYSGSAAYIGTVYTPQAAFTFSGGAGASGSFISNTITISGSAGVHYDEALGRPSGPYNVVSWDEL